MLLARGRPDLPCRIKVHRGNREAQERVGPERRGPGGDEARCGDAEIDGHVIAGGRWPVVELCDARQLRPLSEPPPGAVFSEVGEWRLSRSFTSTPGHPANGRFRPITLFDSLGRRGGERSFVLAANFQSRPTEADIAARSRSGRGIVEPRRVDQKMRGSRGPSDPGNNPASDTHQCPANAVGLSPPGMRYFQNEVSHAHGRAPHL